MLHHENKKVSCEILDLSSNMPTCCLMTDEIDEVRVARLVCITEKPFNVINLLHRLILRSFTLFLVRVCFMAPNVERFECFSLKAKSNNIFRMRTIASMYVCIAPCYAIWYRVSPIRCYLLLYNICIRSTKV